MENTKNIGENIKWVVVGVLLFCFTIIVLFMITDKIHVFDSCVYNQIYKIINPTMTSVVKCITNLGGPLFIVIFALVFSLIIGIKEKDKRTALLFCLNLVIVALMNLLLKNIFMRARPEMINIITESGYSFPSGHSAISMGMYGYLIYIINAKSKNNKVKFISTILLSILILLIGLSRVYLGVHYISDVLASFLIYLSYLIIFTHITENRKDN